MWSKMLLLSLNIFTILAIVNSSNNSSNIVFVLDKQPNNEIGTLKPPNNGTGTFKPPNNENGTFKPPNNGTGTFKPPNNENGTLKPPNNGTGTFKPPNNGTGTFKPPNNGTGTFKPPNNGTGTFKPPNSVTGTSKPPNNGTGTSKPHNNGIGNFKPPNNGTVTSKPLNNGTGISKPPNNDGPGTSNQTLSTSNFQPNQSSTPDNFKDKTTKETLTLGLLDATLNIDRSLNNLNSNDTKSDHNIIVSPICIAAAMSLILLGCRGETKTEVGKLFGFDENTLRETESKNSYKELGMLLNYFQDNSGETLGTQVNLAKAVFIQNGYNITDSYKTVAKEYLNSELIAVDFKYNGEQSQHTINQWVSNQTHGKINDIMPSIPLPDTKTVITSALYFTGEWENPFFVNYTRIKPFYFGSILEDRKISKQNKDFIYVPMMVGNSEVLYYKNDALKFKAIGLPYKGNKFVTYFVLPNTNVSLRGLVAKMDGNVLKQITINAKYTEFTYFVPKMKLESFTNLRPVLQNFGINKVFDSTKADLSNMAADPDSYISDILHKVEIVINEIGTVASAATVVTITRGGQATFNVNKPFLFFIHHTESDAVVFWGTVYKPTPYSTTSPVRLVNYN